MLRPAGFTLAGLVAALAVSALLAAIAGHYYQVLLDNERSTRTRAVLREISSAWMLFQVRNNNHEPKSLDDLKSIVPGDKFYDPWGRPIVLDLDKRTLTSMGPDGKPDAEGGGEDDISEPLPPAPIQFEDKNQDYDSTEHTPPVIDRVYPAGAVYDRTPGIGATYHDSGSGVSADSVRLLHNGDDVTAGAGVSASSIEWTPATDLSTGVHDMLLLVSDRLGNQGSRPWTFIVR